MSFGPRILPRAASAVSPSSDTPSILSMTSPGFRPAFSAGEPAIGATTASRQSAAIVVHEEVLPAASTVPMVAPMPSNSPEMSRSVCLNSSGVRYMEYGSSSAAIIPLIAPSMTLRRSTVPPAYRSVTAR